MPESRKPTFLELDFGMGNIRSLQKAFEYLGQPVEVISTPEKIEQADALLIPGDGAFGMAMANIRKQGFYEPVLDFIKKGKPVLGVCIGFQILFESSEEFDTLEKGFGCFSGRVEKFPATASPDTLEEGDTPVTIPHMGWNRLYYREPAEKHEKEDVLTRGIPNGSYFYFVHSYRIGGVHPHAAAYGSYAGKFTAIVEKDNLFGVQFHPEKSDIYGLRILKNFVEYVQCS